MTTDSVPAELERRIRLLEIPTNQGEDFDATSWFWLIVLGVALPVVALILGWLA